MLHEFLMGDLGFIIVFDDSFWMVIVYFGINVIWDSQKWSAKKVQIAVIGRYFWTWSINRVVTAHAKVQFTIFILRQGLVVMDGVVVGQAGAHVKTGPTVFTFDIHPITDRVECLLRDSGQVVRSVGLRHGL